MVVKYLLWGFLLQTVVLSQQLELLSFQPTNHNPWNCPFTPNNISTICNCFSESEFECHVNESTLKNLSAAKHADQRFTVDCPYSKANPLSESVYSYFKGIPLMNVSLLELNFCPLPRGNFSTSFGDKINQSSIQELTIYSAHPPVQTLQDDSFLRLFQLTKLKLDNNRLEYLPDDVFENQPGLKLLSLRMNKLQVINQTLFRNQHMLKHLLLGSNEISKLDSGAFSNLEKLELLHLQNNKISTLPTGLLQSMTNLIFLDLSNNVLESLNQDDFRFNKKLTELFLRGNAIEMLPNGLFRNNIKLKKLHLQSNRKLSFLHSSVFENLKELNELDLSDCRLTQFSISNQSFENLTQLETLNLARNDLTAISPGWFNGLNNLKKLDISSNQITSIEAHSFSALKLLNQLNFANNALVDLNTKSIFDGLESLQTLYLQDNKIRIIGPEAMEPLINLKSINLARNRLKLDEGPVHPTLGWRQNPFQYNKNLETIDLSENRIEGLYSDWVNMRHLYRLNLKSNLIRYISIGDLSGLSPNEDFEIDLRSNQIKRFNFQWATEVDGKSEGVNMERHLWTKTILLDGNPLVCDCHAYFMAQYMNRSMHGVKHSWTIDAPNLTCAEPASLLGIAPTSVDPSQFVCPCQGDYTPCNCYQRPSDKTLLLECQQRNMTEIPTLIPTVPGYKVQMNLSYNQIDFKKSNTHSINCCVDVTTLDLSYNALNNSMFETQSWTQNLLQFPNLNRLDLSHNSLTSISSAVIDTWNKSSGLKYSLSGNPWSCDCSNLPLLKFVQTSWIWVDDLKQMRCSNGVEHFSDISADELCSPALKSIFVAMPVLALLLFAICVLVYSFRRTVLAWLYNRRLCLWCVVKEDEEDSDQHLYDAFISFSHLDEDFVIQELVPRLERPPCGLPDYRLCLHYRDWLAGEWIPDQIVRSVASSKRTVVILSENFLDSLWGKLEFRTAYQQVLKDKRMRLIVIVKGELPPKEKMDEELQNYLSLNTYLKWNDPWFWDRLRYALPHKKNVSSPCSRISRAIIEHHDTAVKEQVNIHGIKLNNHLPPLPLLNDREKQKMNVILPPDIEMSLTPISSTSSTAPFFSNSN